MKNRSDTDLKRLLRVLQMDSNSRMIRQGDGGMILLQSSRGEFRFRAEVLNACLRRGLSAIAGDRLSITADGEALLRRGAGSDFAAQNIRRQAATVKLRDGGFAEVTINANESPLARLYLRKGRSDGGYISHGEFGAGERLRADFEKANLRARMSVDWDREFSAGGGVGAGAGISDMAVDARARLNEALACLEDSLRGVVLDVCCFLKGLEEVERERRWPPRSAKLMLRTALSILAGHYGLEGWTGPSRGRIRNWGDGSHRPSIS